MRHLKDYRHVIFYGLILAVLVFALKWLQWKFVLVDNAIDIYIGFVALFFTILGIWVDSHIMRPKVETLILEKEIIVPQSEPFAINTAELQKLNLNNREYEVLQLLAQGKSNADIAASLFLSLSTIKTHVSNLYFKMDVKSRTQAITKAKQLKIIE